MPRSDAVHIGRGAELLATDADTASVAIDKYLCTLGAAVSAGSAPGSSSSSRSDSLQTRCSDKDARCWCAEEEAVG